jgi:hypothetical protein
LQQKVIALNRDLRFAKQDALGSSSPVSKSLLKSNLKKSLLGKVENKLYEELKAKNVQEPQGIMSAQLLTHGFGIQSTQFSGSHLSPTAALE